MNRTTTIQLGSWQLDLRSNELSNNKTCSRLEEKQLQLLLYLISQAGKPVTKQSILERLWKDRVVVDDVVAVAISQIRKALSDNPRSPVYIKTIPRTGYQFIFPVTSNQMTRAGNHLLLDPTVSKKSGFDKSHTLNLKPRSKLIYFSAALALSTVLALILPVLSLQLMQPDTLKKAVSEESLNQTNASYYRQAFKLQYSPEPGSSEKGIALLQQVILDEPDFPDAYVVLARLKRNLLFKKPLIEYNAREELISLLHKALDLNPDSSFAYTTLGNYQLFIDWDINSARKSLQQAIDIDPKNSEAHYLFSLLLLAYGEYDKSYQHIKLARQLNPLYYSIASEAWLFAMQNRFNEAWQETEKLLTFKPDELQYHRSAQRLFQLEGNENKAYYHLKKIVLLADYSNEELKKMDEIFAREKLAGVYHWLAFDKKEDRDIGFYPAPLSLARFAITAGDHEAALNWLSEAVLQRQRAVLWLSVDPLYKPLHNYPRYRLLVEKIGIPLINAGN